MPVESLSSIEWRDITDNLAKIILAKIILDEWGHKLL